MNAIDGSFPNDDTAGLAKLGFDTKEKGEVYLEALSPDEIDGLKDRAASLKEGIAAAGGTDTDTDATVFYSLLSDKQDKEIEEAAVNGEDQSKTNVTAKVAPGDESSIEDDSDDDEDDVGSKPKDPLGLAKLGYTKEQVDGWLAQGYSVSDIKNGIAVSGEKNTEKNTEVPAEINEVA
jgi:hypothetical protein